MLDPEIADGFVGVRQRKAAVGLGMREQRRVEVQAVFVRRGPTDPVRKVLRAQLMAIDLAAMGFGVHGVQAQAMRTGDQAVHFIEIAAQFIGCARLAGVVARGRDTAAKAAIEILEAAHIVALPAVQTQRHRRERLQRFIRIDAQQSVTLFRRTISRSDLCFGWILGHGVTPSSHRTARSGCICCERPERSRISRSMRRSQRTRDHLFDCQRDCFVALFDSAALRSECSSQ